MSSGTTFAVGEAVLCTHTIGMYDAKVLGVNKSSAGPIYHVHYQGWKKAWDEHVPEGRLRKRSEENLAEKERLTAEVASAKAKKLDAKRKDAKRKAEPSAAEEPPARPAAPRASAAKRLLAADGQLLEPAGEGCAPAKAADALQPADGGADVQPAPFDADGAAASGAAAPNGERGEIRLLVPQPLKIKMVNDWEAVTREHKLVALPRTPSVAQILDEFCLAKARRTSHERLYTEIRAGVSAYFNQASAAPAAACVRPALAGHARPPSGWTLRLPCAAHGPHTSRAPRAARPAGRARNRPPPFKK